MLCQREGSCEDSLSHFLHYNCGDWRYCRGGRGKKIIFCFLVWPSTPLLPGFQHPPVVSITVFYIPDEKNLDPFPPKTPEACLNETMPGLYSGAP